MSSHTHRFGLEADRALAELYASLGAEKVEQKITALKLKLNMPESEGESGPNFYAFGGEVSRKMVLGCLEYEYLGSKGLIKMALA